MNKHYNYTQSNDDLPEIVEEKCQEAYAQIRLEAASGKKHSHWSIRKKAAAIVSVAAAAALGITFAAPAVASSEIMQNIFAYFGKGSVSIALPEEKNDLTQFAQSVSMQATGTSGTLELQSIYFDGTDLSMTILLTDVPEEYEAYTELVADVSLEIGNETGGDSTFTTVLYHTDFGFCGIVTAEYDGATAETLPLKFTMHSYDALNDYIMIQGDDGSYVPQYANHIPMDVTLETKITASSNYSQTYNIGETKNGYTLESVTVSPFSTVIQLDNALDETQCLRVTDQTGTELEEIQRNKKFEAALTTTTQLHISIIQEDIDGLPAISEFIVPIDTGYRTQATEKPTFDPEKITYIPPREESSDTEYNFASAKHIHAAQEDTPVESLECSASPKKGDSFVKVSVTATKSYLANRSEVASMAETFDSGKNYALAKEFFQIQDSSTNELDLLLVDYTITNTQDAECHFYMSSIGIISKDMMYPVTTSEQTYCSCQEHGGSWSDVCELKPYETKTITIGYLVTAETAQNGFYCIDNSTGFQENGDSFSRLGIIPDLTE